ncbi:MAG: MGMT family protein [Calditrichota bacterium]
MISDTYRKIFRTIKKIPRGRVATYGQIARLSGFPGQARLVGYALHALRNDVADDVPWYRVINAQGMVSLPNEDDAELQRGLLRREGIVFDLRHRVDLERFGWKK